MGPTTSDSERPPLREVPPDRFEKNKSLIRQALIEDIDFGLIKLRKLIEDEYPDILHKVSIPFIYNMYVKDKLRKSTIRQLNLVLKAAEEYNGVNLDTLVEKYFADYFQHDVTYQHCNKNHPKFPELRGVIKISFRARILPAFRVMNAKEGENYNELIKNVYKTRAKTRQALEEHLIITDKAIDIIEDNKDLIKGPIVQAIYLGRNIRIIRAGYEFAMEYLIRRLDAIFPEADDDNAGSGSDPEMEV